MTIEIASFPFNEMVIFHGYVTVYQRVSHCPEFFRFLASGRTHQRILNTSFVGITCVHPVGACDMHPMRFFSYDLSTCHSNKSGKTKHEGFAYGSHGHAIIPRCSKCGEYRNRPTSVRNHERHCKARCAALTI